MPPEAVIPNMAQVILILLGLASTGLLGVLVFIFIRALGRFDNMESNIEKAGKAHGDVLIIVAANQEQIKTLFKVQDEQRQDIRDLNNRADRRRIAT